MSIQNTEKRIPMDAFRDAPPAPPTRQPKTITATREVDPELVDSETPTTEASKVTPPKADPLGHPQWLIDSEPPQGTNHRTYWSIYTALKLYSKPKAKVPNFWGSFDDHIAENHAFVHDNSDDTMAIIVYVTVKGGGGKTTTCTWDGAEDAVVTDGISLIIDADSTAIESAAERLETPREGYLTTPQAADKILRLNWVPTPEQITTFSPRHEESHVRVLTMDTSDLSREEMTTVLQALKPAVHTLFVDTTPGLKETNTYGALDAATLVVVSTLYDNTSAMNAAKITLENKEYGLRSRLARGDDVILAIHGVEPRDYNRRYQYEQAEKFNLRPDQISLFPYDPYVAKARPVRRAEASKKYLFALSEHRRRCAEKAIAWNKKYPLDLLPGSDEKPSVGQPADDATSASQPAADPIGATPVSLEGSA